MALFKSGCAGSGIEIWEKLCENWLIIYYVYRIFWNKEYYSTHLKFYLFLSLQIWLGKMGHLGQSCINKIVYLNYALKHHNIMNIIIISALIASRYISVFLTIAIRMFGKLFESIACVNI